MAKSKAMKLREKQLREGNRDVSKSRGTWCDIKPISRMTKTKQATLEKYEKKHKRNQSQDRYENGSFFIFCYI
ncbi:hypothetical protein [Peribacillus loiseleuriae]|uniref:YqkK n=1 Tax=Peribacillus loiseleuriae TaxID=1679170 RepID=A0A0K9GUJ6_9BACI|nr:hypothetical protein [Peribacillus loiseleuriae]KMY50325.1 hypothetical protein AC625_13135 [Peribacillus loiseleuriae]